MTKSEKAGKIHDLSLHFLRCQNTADLIELRNQIIDEITNCPFKEASMKSVEEGMTIWKRKIDVYVNSFANDTLTQEQTEDANFALTSLRNLVLSEISSLPY